MSKSKSEPDLAQYPELRPSFDRRSFLKKAAAGTAIVALGGAIYRIASDDLTRAARAQKRADGRSRLPPGQRVIESLKPMGGEEGDPRAKNFRLRVHGEVTTETTLDYEQLLALPQVEQASDVHCVTGWTVLGATFKGVQVAELAKLAGVKDSARHVIFEAAHGYTANLPIGEALASDVLVTYRINGKPFTTAHGAPVRGLVPSSYFWKSAKWITGIRFVTRDDPGYWEVRGYHNHADPWKEERYA